MTISQAFEMLTILIKEQCRGGKYYKDIANIMNLEATTHNCEEAAKLLHQLKGISHD